MTRKDESRVVTWWWALASARRSLTSTSIGEEMRESAVRVYVESLMRWALEGGSLPPRYS